MFASAAKLRAGDLSARDEHRRVMAKLSAHARKLLSDGGHAASEGTVRRVEATLAGLAALGSFDPEPAGALAKDRDPPGFEAFGSANATEDSEPTAEHEHAPGKAKPSARDDAAEAKRAHAEAQRVRQEAEAERKRAAEARAKKQAALRELESQVRAAQHALAEREREQERAAKALAAAAAEVENARATLASAEAAHAKAEKEA
jgi:colicin import membrane protein